MITITGTPKEIAALVDELQERRKESRGPDYKGALTLEKVTSARIADCGPTTDKLGDPRPITVDEMSEEAKRILKRTSHGYQGLEIHDAEPQRP